MGNKGEIIMHNVFSLKDFFSKYRILILTPILVGLLLGIFFLVKNHNEELKNNNLNEETVSEQAVSDIDCETIDFLTDFSEETASLICARLQDFVYDYNTLKYDEEYLGFTYVKNSFSGSSFKIKSALDETFTMTIKELEDDLTLTPNPQLR